MKASLIYITRDLQYGSPIEPYILWKSKPKYRDNQWYLDHNDAYMIIASIDTRNFEKIFHVRLKGGPRSITKRRLVA